jgi:DNA repair exonuclease SbcCD nuclease subunit
VKILLASDLQLESGQSLGHGEYGPGSRFADQEAMLGQIADIAFAENVELTILAGDTFDRSKPSPWAILALQKFLERVEDAIIISGNHDVKSLALPSVLGCFEGERIEVFDKPSVKMARDNLRITLLPWMPAASFDAAGPTDRDERNDWIGQKLGAVAQELGRHDFSGRHILIGHWSIRGASTSTGIGVDVFREPLVPLEALTSGYDLVAFGHIHKIQVLNETPPVLYLGGPWVNNFGEANEPHGVWIYDTDLPEMRFVPVTDPRRFLTYTVMPLQDPPFERFLEDMTGAVVRVRYEVTETEARRVDQGAIRQAFDARGADKVFIQPTVVKKSRARIGTSTEALDDGQTVDLWLEHDDPPADQRKRILTLHDVIRAGITP